jgi:hypothetical protein
MGEVEILNARHEHLVMHHLVDVQGQGVGGTYVRHCSKHHGITESDFLTLL